MCVVKDFTKNVSKSSKSGKRLRALLEKVPPEYFPMIEGFIQGVIDGQYSDILNDAGNG